MTNVKLFGSGRSVLGRAFFVREKVFTLADIEILERFADHVSKRVWDFSREWKRLSMSFSVDLVKKLLSYENYIQKFLIPTEGFAAVLFCDIVSFTHLCETVLKQPQKIGNLINQWGEGVVNIIWENGGVFDKMVGDCVIGLWGPPFFEMSATEICLRAINTALRIKEFSSQIFVTDENNEKQALRVTFGINFCRLCAGLFGPNEAYTAFSSGMNNAARLQHCAGPNEILCMDTVKHAVEIDPKHPLLQGCTFGPSRAEWVKNVSQPLQFFSLVEPEKET